MKTYTATLFDCPISGAERNAAEEKFCAALEAHLGGEARVVPAHEAYQRAFAKYEEIPLPAAATDGERAAVALWMEAEVLAEAAVFSEWHGWKAGTLRGAHFEITVH